MTLEQLQARLNAMKSVGAEAWRASAPALQVIYAGGVREHFQNSVSPAGVPWPALSHPRASGGNKPLLDRGLLQASVSALVTEDSITLRANGPGAAIHQFGGKIVPVKAQALAIPITREAQRSGGPRRFPRQLFRPHGKSYLAESVEKGKGSKKRTQIVVHFLLRASVTVPARPYLGISEATQQRADEVVAANYVALIRRKLGLS